MIIIFKKYSYLALVSLLLVHTHCAFFPELNRFRVDNISRGPEFQPYEGLKKRIAVLDFENFSGFGPEKLGSAFSDMLISQLSRSNRFILIERSKIAKILEEQALGQSGAISEESAARVGQLLGAESIITGSILRAGQESGAHDFNNKKNDWKLALKATVGFISVSYRLISTETGEILASNEISKREIKPAFGLKTKDWDFSNLYDFDQTVVGIATRKAVNEIAIDIVEKTKEFSWVGKIIQVASDSIVYFKPGIEAGIQIGQAFDIYQDYNAAIENNSLPDSGDFFDRPKAKIEVTGFIGDQVSRARVIMGQGINRGDLVKFVTKTKSNLPE